MPNQKLSESAIKEIRETICALKGINAANAVSCLSKKYNVSRSQIYTVTKSLRPQRKTRSDKGNTAVFNESGLIYIKNLVVQGNMSVTDALKKAKQDGYKVDMSLASLRRHLRAQQSSPAQIKLKNQKQAEDNAAKTAAAKHELLLFLSQLRDKHKLSDEQMTYLINELLEFAPLKK